MLLIARSGRESEFVTELLSDGSYRLLGDDGRARLPRGARMRPRADGLAAGQVRTVPGMQPLPGLHVEAMNYQLTDAEPSMARHKGENQCPSVKSVRGSRMMAMLPDEGEVAGEIFAAMAMVGEPGDAITPDLAALASQVAGAEAAGRWLKAGHTWTTAGRFAGSTSTSAATSPMMSDLAAGLRRNASGWRC